MFARFAVVVSGVVIGGVLVASCSYSKEDAPVPSRVTAAVVPTGPRPSVVGTLPPIAAAPPAAAPPPTTAAAPSPPSAESTEVPTPPPTPRATTAPRATTPPTSAAPRPSGPVTVQAGAFTTRAAAEQALATLGAKGFGGFAVAGDGPFRLVRGGLSGDDAAALVRSLSAMGVAAFVRR